MRLNRPEKPHSDPVKQLLHAVRSLERVKTKPEKLFWEQQASVMVNSALKTGKENTLFNTLDALWEEDPEAYESMADLVENCVQSTINDDGTMSLMIAIPVLAWSRNDLPSGQTDAKTIAQIKQAIHKHWLVEGVHLSLGHTLYSPEQLPDGFVATHKLAKKLFADALQNIDTAHTKKSHAHEFGSFLADCRFWLGVVTAPIGAAIFQAQLDATGAIDLLAQEAAWRTDAQAAVKKQFIGCAYELMPPEGYYEANRSAELDVRGFSLQASALMIMTTLEMPAENIRAIIAACHSSQFEEYRISLLSKNGTEILQGITWPLLGKQETQSDLLDEIQAHLKSLGIQRVRVIDQALSMDYCDDCGTPLFPDLDAELVHPDAPDEDEHTAKNRILH